MNELDCLMHAWHAALNVEREAWLLKNQAADAYDSKSTAKNWRAYKQAFGAYLAAQRSADLAYAPYRVALDAARQAVQS